MEAGLTDQVCCLKDSWEQEGEPGLAIKFRETAWLASGPG
jgi:hypothetical protein